MTGGDDRRRRPSDGAIAARIGGWVPRPETVALTAPPDPFQVQPGTILADRFCVIGRVRHVAEGWRVPVTDVRRLAGDPPHHRLLAHRIAFGPGQAPAPGAVRVGLFAHQVDQMRVVAVSDLPDGLFVVSTPADGPALRLPLTDPEAAAVVHTLATFVRVCHEHDHAGLRYDLRDLRLDGARVQLTSWRHVLDVRPGDPAARVADVTALVDTLRGLGTRRTAALLEDLDPSSPAQALERLILASEPATDPIDSRLPTEPPFVGRSAELRRMATRIEQARSGAPGWVWVSGPPGIGRTRLLRETAHDSPKDDRLLVPVAFRPNMPTTGLAILLDAIASAVHRLGAAERERVTTRIRRAVGAQLPVVRQASPALATLLGDVDREVVDMPLQERFLRHAGALADLVAAVGTPERVLVLTLDDVHLADAGVRAVVWNLLTPGRRHHSAIVVSTPQPPGLPGARSPGHDAGDGPGAPDPAAGEADPASDRRPGPLVLAGTPPEHLALAPWTPSELERWLAATLQVEDARGIAWAIHQDAAGIPGAAWNRLRRLAEADAVRVDDDGTLHVRDHQPDEAPPPATLSTDARVVGSCCWIRAEHVGPFWLSEVTAWSPARVRVAVTELVEAGILVQEVNGVFAWRDERTREHFATQAGPDLLREAHARVARWLDDVDPHSTVIQRAWHLEHAALPGPDPELAALHLTAGSSQLEHGNVDRAAWHYARVPDRTDDPELLRRAQRGFAAATLLLDDVDLARTAFLRAMEGAGPEEVVDIANEAVSAFYLRGANRAVVDLADRALRTRGVGLPSAWPQALLIGLAVLVAWGLRVLFRRPVTDPLADRVAQLHTQLLPALAVSHPWIAASSMLRAPAATALRTTGSAARARAFLAPIVAAVSPPRALAMLDEAERHAQHDPLNLPVVLHMRGQTELSLGRYAEGQSSIARAVEGFRQSGDQSVAVISLAISAYHALDREPTAALLHRIETAMATAYRMRNTAILRNLSSMRLWVRTRAGELRGEAIDREIAGFVAGDPLQDVAADGLIALTLLQDERPGEALAQARHAVAARERLPTRLPLLDAVGVPLVLALIATGSLDEAEAELVKVERRARGNPPIRVATAMCRARLEAHRGDSRGALDRLASLVAQGPVHGEWWHVLAAHRWMADLLAGLDPAAVAPHRDLHAELGRRLHLGTTPATPPAAEPTSGPPPAAGGVSAGSLAAALEALRTTLGPALPTGVGFEVRCTAGLPVPEPRDVFELLVVNLVLAARDGAPRALGMRLWAEEAELEAQELGGELPPGLHLRVGVEVVGASVQPPRGAMRECRDLARALGGALSTHDSRIDVWIAESSAGGVRAPALPPGPSPGPVVGTAAVVTADERLARTLVTELVRLGWGAVAAVPGEAVPPDAGVVLVDEALVDQIAEGPRVVRIRPRSAGPGPDVLRVPFVVRELEQLLEPSAQDRDRRTS